MNKDAKQYIILDFTLDDYKKFDDFVVKVSELVKKRHKKIIINFVQEIEFDSWHLKALHRLLKMARFKLVDIRIVTPSRRMKDTFHLTRLDIYTRIYNSVEEAKKEEGFIPFIKYGSIVAIGIFVLLYAHIIKWLIFSWRIDPYYSHGFIVLLVSLFFIWKRKTKIRRPKSHFSLKSFFFIGVAVLLYLMGYFKGINFFIGLSLIFFLLGFVLLLYGKNIYKHLFLPITLLFFAIPIPRIDEFASLLQHFTARWVTFFVSKLGIDAYNIGIKIFFKDSYISIDAPCSGLRSLIALLFVATLFISLLKTSYYKKFLLSLTIIPISLLANLLRITTLILIANTYGLKIAMFYFHHISGILFFIIALSILILEKGLLKCDWEIA